jgi:hypothetical protein
VRQRWWLPAKERDKDRTSFLKKRSKKLLRMLPTAAGRRGGIPLAANAKVFWFFFSKKNSS